MKRVAQQPNTGVLSSVIERARDTRASGWGRRLWRQSGDIARRRRIGARREVTLEMAERFAGARRPGGATRAPEPGSHTPWALRFSRFHQGLQGPGRLQLPASEHFQAY